MSLHFLADESCDFGVVRALRSKRYDVLAVGEITSRSDDEQIMEQAYKEGRILLTEDKDFGWLAYVGRKACPGVILMRFPGNARKSLSESVVSVVEKHKEELLQSFTVIEPGYVRISRKPE